VIHKFCGYSLLLGVNFFSIDLRGVSIDVPCLFFSLHFNFSHQYLLVRLLLVYHSLQITEISFKKTALEKFYVIFLSRCRTCQLRFLYIDFCLWSSFITLTPLLLILCLLSIFYLSTINSIFKIINKYGGLHTETP
jgi:hypothetical protein